ncbi:hypothetical protein ACU8V3_00365 [Cobetia marina]
MQRFAVLALVTGDHDPRYALLVLRHLEPQSRQRIIVPDGDPEVRRQHGELRMHRQLRASDGDHGGRVSGVRGRSEGIGWQHERALWK